MTPSGAWSSLQLLGVVLAGGESRRYGHPKALAHVGGRPMARWALDALGAHFPMCGMVGNEPSEAEGFGVPGRADVVPGLGPMGGLITALEWAKEVGLGGAFLLGCDMPLIEAALIGRILDFKGGRKSALVPAGPGPLGMEPLCAAYRIECLGAAKELAGSGKRSMKALLDAFEFDLVPLEELGDADQVALSFTNVNTVEDGRKVEALLNEKQEPAPSKEPQGGPYHDL